MGLQEYKRKRDFKKTPEPAGANSKSAPGRQFVIQKHAASRLHYDFRLELDGTLKSWAVPKGPSLDPSVKSLAVQVEDHPLEYATFEGVIPKGEYGGGTVMVWDHGTWEPEEDADRGFRKGTLKFKLNGEKLHGSWALVRMGGRAGDGGKNWLLIKHRDAAAKPDAKSAIVDRKPRSVVTKRTLDEIASDADAVWTSQGATKKKASASAAPKSAKKSAVKTPAKKKSAPAKSQKAQLEKLSNARQAAPPSDFSPQLATLADRVPKGDAWLHELKFDGYRIVAHCQKSKVRLVTRNGNDWTERFLPVAKALEQLELDDTLLDGEVVSLDSSGLSNFQQLQNHLKTGDAKSLVYYVFDVPYLQGFDLTQVPLLDRKQVLATALLSTSPENDGVVRYSDHILGHGNDVLQHACRSAMEGVICKRADSAYQQSRSTSWLKVKCLKLQEFVIAGYTKPEGTRVGFGALLLGYYDRNGLQYAGRVGTGFTSQSLRELTQELKSRQIKESPFATRLATGERRGVTWIKPELVCQVEFSEWTADGRLRHPSFQGLREDKPASEVHREKPKPIATLQNGQAAKKNKSLSDPRRSDEHHGRNKIKTTFKKCQKQTCTSKES